MMCPNVPPARCEAKQAEQTEHDHHRVETRPLPITAAQVQPHPELIERQCHGRSIDKSAKIALRSIHRGKQQYPSYGREEENSVVQMMHMRAVHMQEQVRHPP